MWEFWDKIYCINLDRRPDRWQECLVEFEKLKLTNFITRFSGIDMAHGGMGCYASHIAVMKEAINYDHVLILEDDVEFFIDLATLEKSFNDLMRQDWDVFFVGTRPKGIIKKITENLTKIGGGSCTHAIGYNKKALNLCYQSLVEQYKKNNPPHYFVPIDNVGVYEHISKLNCFSPYPLACVQRKSYSDLRNEITDFGQDNLKEYENNIEN